MTESIPHAQTTADARKRPRHFGLLSLIGIVTSAAAVFAFAYFLRSCGWAGITDTLKQKIGPPFHSLFAPLDHVLNDLPMWVAQCCAIGLFILAGIFAWSMPRRFIYLGAPDQARWRDLRIWATLVLVPYIIIYYLLGR